MNPIKLVLPVLALLFTTQTSFIALSQNQTQPTETAKIYAVVDGDTVKAILNDKKATIRLIGIDAPEVKPPQCFTREAAQAMRTLVLNKTVKLEADKVGKDKFGRLLRYVYVDEGQGERMVNEEMLKGGFASTLVIDNDKYKERLAAAQEVAKSASAGIWGACGAPVATTAAQPAPSQQAVVPVVPVAPAPVAPAGNCDPSYPEVCIAPAPPDLDCKDVPYHRFKVLQPDPHHFDRDHDGIGCEK